MHCSNCGGRVSWKAKATRIPALKKSSEGCRKTTQTKSGIMLMKKTFGTSGSVSNSWCSACSRSKRSMCYWSRMGQWLRCFLRCVFCRKSWRRSSSSPFRIHCILPPPASPSATILQTENGRCYMNDAAHLEEIWEGGCALKYLIDPDWLKLAKEFNS